MSDTITIGMDLGDKYHITVVFDSQGNELEVGKVTNTKAGIKRFFSRYKGSTVALETGTHSPWISRFLGEMGCRVLVGNPRKLRFIWDSQDKSDERDARMLGMVCRIEPRLLCPLHHRGSQAQADLVTLKSRDIVVSLKLTESVCPAAAPTVLSSAAEPMYQLIFGQRLNRYLMPSPSWENKSTNWMPRSIGCAGKNTLRLPACSKCPALVL